MKALISPQEPCGLGQRIAEIHPTGFSVAAPLFWVDVGHDVQGDTYYYNPATETVELIPVVAAAPSTPTATTSLQYLSRFTDAEQTAIYSAALANAQMLRFITELAAAQEVVFADPRLAAGMNALVAVGLLTQARSEEILPLALRAS